MKLVNIKMTSIEKNSSELAAKTRAFLKNEDLGQLFPDQDEKDLVSIIEVIDTLHKISNLAQLRDDSAFEILEIVKREWKLQQAKLNKRPTSKFAEIFGMFTRDVGPQKFRFAGIAVSIAFGAVVLLISLGPSISNTIADLPGNTASKLSESVTTNLTLSPGILGIIVIAAITIIFINSRRE